MTAESTQPAIRVLHVITGLGHGGAETMLARLVSTPVPGVEHAVISLSPGGVHASRLKAAGVPVHVCNLRQAGGLARAPAILRQAVRRHRPNIIQGWMYHGNVTAQLLRPLAPMGARPRVILGIRCTEYSVEGEPRPVVRLDAALSRFADLLIANSDAGLSAHLAHGYRPARSVVVHNGIDVGHFKPDPQARADQRRALGLAADTPVFIHVANVRPLKNHALLLAAMRQLPSCTALLVGEGTEGLEGLPNTRLLGRRDDVDRLLSVADAAICCSLSEGFSNAVAEAMAAGLPVVCTDVGDNRVIVGDTGWLTAPVVAQFTATLRAAAQLPLAELQVKGSRARSRIIENFTLTRAVERFTDCYRDLVGKA